MKSKKELYNSIMESVSTQVKKVLNEGAGAGYDVEISGLNISDIKIGKREIKGKDEIIHFSAIIEPSIVEWSAMGYYDGVTSEGIEYNGDILIDYSDEDREVQGGTVYGYVYAQDVEDYDGREHNSDDGAALYYIKEHLEDFKIKTKYGVGWLHVDLTNPMVFHDIEVSYESRRYECVFIDTIEIIAEQIVDDINWFFENKDEIYAEAENDSIDESVHYKDKSNINEEEQLSQSEKMDLWHEGKRDQNLKACGADKLRKNLAICKAKGYDAEVAAIEAEIKSRGLKESAINEGEITSDLEAKYGKPFADLVAGVLAQERDIDPEKDGDIMFNELVPGEGNADNLGGELLRAAERIAYRYWNDGDKAGEGYGRETVNPAVRFMEAKVGRQDGCNLCYLVDEIYDFVNKGYCDLVDNDYEKLTLNILRETILYIILKQAWNIPNKEDMWDFKDNNQDIDRDDEDEWDYDDRW